MENKRIRPIVICLFRHNGRILVFEGFDSVKQNSHYRPLGGGIEFGETGREAIIREIREELGAEIENVQWLGTLESIFTCEGQARHEIVLVFDAEFVDKSYYERPVLQAYEQGVETFFNVYWKSLEEVERGEIRLVPEGLLEFLSKQ